MQPDYRIPLILICSLLVGLTACQKREHTGAAVGGAVGAGTGAVLGGEEHRAEGAILGGLIGGAIGYFAGTQLTEDDQKNVYDILESTDPGETETWTSENGVTYHITPSEKWKEQDRVYRELDIEVEKPDGDVDRLERVAYKDEGEDKWEISRADADDLRQDQLERRERGYYEYEDDGYYEEEEVQPFEGDTFHDPDTMEIYP